VNGRRKEKVGTGCVDGKGGTRWNEKEVEKMRWIRCLEGRQTWRGESPPGYMHDFQWAADLGGTPARGWGGDLWMA